LTQGTTNGVRIPPFWHYLSWYMGLRAKTIWQLFKVTIDASTADAVLVKVYGDGTDITIDRESTYTFTSLVWNFRPGFVSNVTCDRGTQGPQAPVWASTLFISTGSLQKWTCVSVHFWESLLWRRHVWDKNLPWSCERVSSVARDASYSKGKRCKWSFELQTKSLVNCEKMARCYLQTSESVKGRNWRFTWKVPVSSR
jgi:hypothetical protein